MNKIFQVFIQYLYPKKKKCLLCGVVDKTSLCSLCASSIKFIHDRRCLKCGKALLHGYEENICPDCKETSYIFDSVYSCFDYISGGRELIHKLKYDGKEEGGQVLARYMGQLILEEGLKSDIIVPVPIHNKKIVSRGFNQAYIIGMHLSKLIKIPLWDCLLRTKDTKDQYNLDKVKRRINVIGAFSLNMLYNVSNKTVLLVDDVYTTGSTADECSKVLKASGAKKIYVVTAATGANT